MNKDKVEEESFTNIECYKKSLKMISFEQLKIKIPRP